MAVCRIFISESVAISSEIVTHDSGCIVWCYVPNSPQWGPTEMLRQKSYHVAFLDAQLGAEGLVAMSFDK